MLSLQAWEHEFGFKHPYKKSGMLPTIVTLGLGRRWQEDPLGLHLIGELQVPWTQTQVRVPACMCMYTHYTHTAHVHITHITHITCSPHTQTHTTHKHTPHTPYKTHTHHTHHMYNTQHTHTKQKQKWKKNFKRFMQSFHKIKITRMQYNMLIFFLIIKEMWLENLKDKFAVAGNIAQIKSTCFSRGPRFNALYSHSVLQPSAAQVPGNPVPSSTRHTWPIDIDVRKTLIHIR